MAQPGLGSCSQDSRSKTLPSDGGGSCGGNTSNSPGVISPRYCCYDCFTEEDTEVQRGRSLAHGHMANGQGHSQGSILAPGPGGGPCLLGLDPPESSSETWSFRYIPEKFPEKRWKSESSQTKPGQRPGTVLNSRVVGEQGGLRVLLQEPGELGPKTPKKGQGIAPSACPPNK